MPLVNYKIPDGQDTFSTVMSVYGSLEMYGKFMLDNKDGITSFTVTGITHDPYSILLAGDQRVLFPSGNTFTYNNNIYDIVSSELTVAGDQTFVNIPNTGPSLPYGPSGVTITIYSSLTHPSTAFYDPALFVSAPPEVTISIATPSKIQTITGQDGQSIYDICAMTYGGIENIYKLIQDNSIDSINETSLAQKSFTYDTSRISDKSYYNFRVSKGIIISTGEGSKGILLPSEALADDNSDLLVDNDGSILIDG